MHLQHLHVVLNYGWLGGADAGRTANSEYKDQGDFHTWSLKMNSIHKTKQTVFFLPLCMNTLSAKETLSGINYSFCSRHKCMFIGGTHTVTTNYTNNMLLVTVAWKTNDKPTAVK